MDVGISKSDMPVRCRWVRRPKPLLRYGTVSMPMSQPQPAVPSGMGFIVAGMAIYEET
jgi:hypothetical protein